MSLLPTCLRVAGKVVSRPPLLCETLRRRWCGVEGVVTALAVSGVG